MNDINGILNLSQLDDDDILIFSPVNIEEIGTWRMTVKHAKNKGIPSEWRKCYVFNKSGGHSIVCNPNIATTKTN